MHQGLDSIETFWECHFSVYDDILLCYDEDIPFFTNHQKILEHNSIDLPQTLVPYNLIFFHDS